MTVVASREVPMTKQVVDSLVNLGEPPYNVLASSLVVRLLTSTSFYCTGRQVGELAHDYLPALRWNRCEESHQKGS